MEKTPGKKFEQFEIEPLSNGNSSGLHLDAAQKNDSHKRHPVSDTKRALSQYCASGALSLLIISFGSTFGFSTIIIAELDELRKKDEDFISTSQLTWMSSVNYFAILIGALFSGLLSQWLGRRNSLILSTLPYIASWLLLYSCGDGQLWPIFLGLLLLGCSGGIIESPLQIYVSEISEPRQRGAMSASIGAVFTVGMFLETLLAKYLDWRSLALVSACPPLLALLALTFVPESPYWLASKGRYEESLKALAWLRGWCPISQLPQDEFRLIVSSATNRSDKPASVRRYLEPPTLKPFALVSFAFFVSSFNGSVAVLSWAIQLFREIDSPLEEHDATVTLTGMQLVANVAVIIMLPYTGKRGPTLGSLAVAALAFFVAAAYLYCACALGSEQSNWLPTIAVLTAVGSSFFGIKQVPWILTGELFASDVRSQMAGILAGSCQIFSAVASKTYVSTREALSLPGAFLYFACVNFLGLVVLYYAMPETEGKSLAEIERHFSGRNKTAKRLSATRASRFL